MRKIQKFNLALAVVLALAVIFSFFTEIKTIIAISLGLLLIIGYYIYKEKIGQELVVALLFSIALTSYHFYEYTTPNIFLGKINLFTLISWTFGLVLLREIYERTKVRNKFVVVYIFYLLALILLEYIGFYFLNIQLNSKYPGLLGLGIIHAPTEIKIFYLLAGPIYLWITDYLKVK